MGLWLSSSYAFIISRWRDKQHQLESSYKGGQPWNWWALKIEVLEVFRGKFSRAHEVALQVGALSLLCYLTLASFTQKYIWTSTTGDPIKTVKVPIPRGIAIYKANNT